MYYPDKVSESHTTAIITRLMPLLERFTPPDFTDMDLTANNSTNANTTDQQPPIDKCQSRRYHMQLAHHYELQVACGVWHVLVSLIQQVEDRLVPLSDALLSFIVRHFEQYHRQLPFLGKISSFAHDSSIMANHPEVCVWFCCMDTHMSGRL
jgi:hypothetical protein